ncbi:MAG: diguanylate cyclase domain [Tardiphaga sp.]|nr:diguanylate cyclase domain [Tardiphaga sp.]
MSDAELIASLRAQLDVQAAVIAKQAASLAHSQKIFDLSSAAARIGVWECTLADESLAWTDVVYDLFDQDRGTALDRAATLQCYPEESLQALIKARSKAIDERSGFSLETEIVTAKGNRRWIRITATVECVDGVAVRIFGMKQDITEEKILADRNRYLAEFDVMTGLANRSRFQSKLSELSTVAPPSKPFGALLLIDLDEFKSVNDSCGHAAGDECLREAALRISRVCVGAELVARIGGDEFAVMLGTEMSFGAISETAAAIVAEMSRAVSFRGRLLQLGASVGIALVEDCTPSQLFVMADTALYAAKNAGRNTFRIHRPGSGKRAGRPHAAA